MDDTPPPGSPTDSPEKSSDNPALEFLELFFGETEKEIQSLYDSLAKGDLGHVSLLSHRLRGRAQVMGFPLFGEICGRIEALADSEETLNLPTELKALEANFHELEAEHRS